MRAALFSTVITIFYLVNGAYAVDFGKRGASFVIREEGFLAMLKRKLSEVDIKQEQEKMQAIARERVNSPQAIDGISPAVKSREFYWDPTYILQKDVILPCGKVLYKAGESVNPLEHMEFERVLLFIDGRYKDQLEWARGKLWQYAQGVSSGRNKLEVRVILVGGSVFKVQEELGQRVYFDQNGEIVTKFGIKASPAIAKQEGKLIKITEIVI